IQWMIDNDKIEKDYLSRPNQTSASNGGYKNWTDATYLVRLDTKTKKYLTGDEAGIGTSDYVVSVNGTPTKYDEVTGTADLEVDTTVNGIPVKSVFTLLKESANEHTIAEYESICGVESGTISTIASEFANAQRPATDSYKSGAQHANGFYTTRAILMLNILRGMVDRKGGISPGGGSYHGSKPAHPTKVDKKGVPIDRHKVAYQGTKPKPTRPWYPLAGHGVQQEIFPSIKMGYPYKVKAVLLYYSNPAYSMPYAQTVREVLQDTKAIPLLISIDAFVNESNMYADYILPDTTYLERWSIGHLAPHIKTKGTYIRQPVVGTIDPVTHDYTPINPDTKTMEDIHIMIAKKLGLPNFGKDGMGTGKDLNKAWDYYNEYLNGGEFSGGLDPNTEHMMMAGKFENPNNRYDGDWMKHPYGKLITIYSEEAAITKHSMTKEYFSGVAKYEPIKDSNGNELKDDDYPFIVITHKPVYHTQSRTAENLWLMMLEPKNFVEINSKDAEKIGVKTGDYVRITSPSNPTGVLDPTGRDKVKVKVSEHIREGVVDISHSFGHWAMGSSPYYVDGKSSGSDERKGRGYRMTELMRADPVLKDVCLTDPIGGS
ncbi:MAG: molybdopterin dinucleotide binding domain-containing protein, partial [Methanosarcinales archaeon]